MARPPALRATAESPSEPTNTKSSMSKWSTNMQKPSVEKILQYQVQKELDRLLMEIGWDGTGAKVVEARAGWLQQGDNPRWLAHAIVEFEGQQFESLVEGPSVDTIGQSFSLLAFELATHVVAAQGSTLGEEQIKASRERRIMVRCPECEGQGWLGDPEVSSYQTQCSCCLGNGKLTAQALFQWEEENATTLTRMERRKKKAFWSM